MSETYTLSGRGYPIIGYEIHPVTGLPTVPLLDIPMISDYTWQKKCLESRLKHRDLYAKHEDVDQEIAKLEKWIAEHSPD